MAVCAALWCHGWGCTVLCCVMLLLSLLVESPQGPELPAAAGTCLSCRNGKFVRLQTRSCAGCACSCTALIAAVLADWLITGPGWYSTTKPTARIIAFEYR